jgi:hypothetical protein
MQPAGFWLGAESNCAASLGLLAYTVGHHLGLVITWWVYYRTELYDDTDMSCTIVFRGYRPFRQVTAKVAGAGVSHGAKARRSIKSRSTFRRPSPCVPQSS